MPAIVSLKWHKVLIVSVLAWLLLHAPVYAEQAACARVTGDGRIGNAGCFIVLNDRLVMVRGLLRHTLSLPGGTSEPGESARTTARRETLEETGLEVCVGEMLSDLDRRFLLYRCRPKAATSIAKLGPLARWRHEVSEVVLVDPCRLDPREMRFAAQRAELCEFLTRLRGAR